MWTRAIPALALALVLAALGVGVAEFPRAEEPGRAEADGIELSFANARLDGGGDWSLASAAVRARSGRSGVRLSAQPGEIALYSRGLPVFPHTCYTLAIAATPPAGIGVHVVDGDLRRTLAPVTPLVDARPGRPVRFSSRGERTIVVAIGGTSGGTTLLESLRLRRAAAPDC